VAVGAFTIGVRVVAEQHERRTVLHRVVHVRRRVRQADATEHAERGAPRRLRIAIGNCDELAFVRRLYQLQLGTVDERVADRS
jgi:hypothetical protein